MKRVSAPGQNYGDGKISELSLNSENSDDDLFIHALDVLLNRIEINNRVNSLLNLPSQSAH